LLVFSLSFWSRADVLSGDGDFCSANEAFV
jgi:hypothetical protein